MAGALEPDNIAVVFPSGHHTEKGQAGGKGEIHPTQSLFEKPCGLPARGFPRPVLRCPVDLLVIEAEVEGQIGQTPGSSNVVRLRVLADGRQWVEEDASVVAEIRPFHPG